MTDAATTIHLGGGGGGPKEGGRDPQLRCNREVKGHDPQVGRAEGDRVASEDQGGIDVLSPDSHHLSGASSPSSVGVSRSVHHTDTPDLDPESSKVQPPSSPDAPGQNMAATTKRKQAAILALPSGFRGLGRGTFPHKRECTLYFVMALTAPPLVSRANGVDRCGSRLRGGHVCVWGAHTAETEEYVLF